MIVYGIYSGVNMWEGLSHTSYVCSSNNVRNGHYTISCLNFVTVPNVYESLAWTGDALRLPDEFITWPFNTWGLPKGPIFRLGSAGDTVGCGEFPSCMSGINGGLLKAVFPTGDDWASRPITAWLKELLRDPLRAPFSDPLKFMFSSSSEPGMSR